MRLTKLYTRTSKSVPADETSLNARLLIKAGYIHKEMAGVYTYLPLGLRVIEKISEIVRDEINKVDGQEIKMSNLQNKELWEQTGRWDDKKVDVWLKTKLQNGQEIGLGWTNEEPLINSLKPFIKSYRDLPLYIYQIQYKFRGELRAKSGLMRGREFIMKDLYSFSKDMDEHKKYYERVAKAYMNIYDQLGIGKTTVRTFASGGSFSKFSDEFQTISDIGEDTIYVDEDKNIAINKEVYNEDVIKELGLDSKKLVEKRAVEVGNIFTLGTKYTDDLGLYFEDKNGSKQSIISGCYGLGISRLMGLLAEHFADEKGLVWPKSVAPALVYLISLGDDAEVTKQTEKLYRILTELGIEVIYDDRDIKAGEKFADADLLGIPYRIVISNKNIDKGQFELKERTSDKTHYLTEKELVKFIAS